MSFIGHESNGRRSTDNQPTVLEYISTAVLLIRLFMEFVNWLRAYKRKRYLARHKRDDSEASEPSE